MKPSRLLVVALPPTSPLFSKIVTACPASLSICAAASPLIPAPMIVMHVIYWLLPHFTCPFFFLSRNPSRNQLFLFSINHPRCTPKPLLPHLPPSQTPPS